MLHRSLIILFSLVTFLGCQRNQEGNKISKTIGKSVNVKYAKGFKITDYGNHKLLEIIKPWQNSDKTFVYALTNTDAIQENKLNVSFENVINIPINKIVVTSTTHIPALELLGVEESLVGFPETKYISSEKTRKRVDDGSIRELGKNEGINTEVLLELDPDVVIGFGIEGVNRTFENIQKANIPVIYNGDWVEDSPLAKAEWIKFFGVLYDKQQLADSIFRSIESEYLSAKQLASKTTKIPTILSGAMYKDIWYLPNGSSTEAVFLKDANVNYLWKETSGTGSLALNFESVFAKGNDADIWLSPSNYANLEALKNANSHYTKFKAFKTKQVYSFNNTIGKTGGVLYYELGTARPDLVLKDIIKICHPELLEGYEPNFFKPLK